MLCDNLQDTDLLSKSLLSFNAFTGCDTVSAFCGKRKLKPLKVIIKNQKYINEFPEIGDEPGIQMSNLKFCKHLIVMSIDIEAIE